ncbi:MAG: alkene reductase [Methylococcaceae bacterium]
MNILKEKDLFSPIKLGPYTLRNRIVMAPVTRCRAEKNIPTEMNRIYYQQRASAGLIITEGSQISPQGAGYPNTPGIYNDNQIKAWRKITGAVHDEGGRIFLQLWHVGRVSYPGIQPNDEPPVAPSAIKAEGDYVQPRALEIFDIVDIMFDYKNAAESALAADFDGVEVHAANGYLIDQFLRDATNKRTDKYGGGYENRSRFLFDVLQTVIGVWGGDRVGVRFSPTNTFNGMSDSNPEALFNYVVEQLNPLNLAYLHVLEGSIHVADTAVATNSFNARSLRNVYTGTYMANNGYNKDSANKTIATGCADLVSFGDLFISNPDLPERFLKNSALNQTDMGSRYGGDEKGYIDYPTLKSSAD